MPRLVAHTLNIADRKGQGEVISGRMVLQPPKRGCGFKRLRKVRSRVVAITKVNRQAGAVLRVSRGGTDLGPLAGGLIACRFHIKKDSLLQGMGAIAAE